eukprot:5514016-Pyramimonas_sp.AAC.1
MLAQPSYQPTRNWPAHARARSGQLVWRDRRGRGGADRWALRSEHFTGCRLFEQARYHGNVDNGTHDDGSSDARDDDDNDDGKAQ